MTVNNILSKVIIFTAGAVVGSGVTYLLVKEKCARDAQVEIDKVVEDFMHRDDNVNKGVAETDVDMSVEPNDEVDEEHVEEEFNDIVKNEGYVAYAKDRLNKKEEKNDMKRPYVIEPEEFGEEGYPTVSLWYFEGDETLVDNHQRKIIRNADELVGEDFADHFGEYEDDSVFVRNDELEIDYEILRDERSFSEIS